MTLKLMTELNLTGRRVLIRQDLNVPIKDGQVTSDARIKASLPTIRLALQAGAKVILMSHLGRPAEGVVSLEHSLAPVAKFMGEQLGETVSLVEHWHEGIDLRDGEVTMLENVRFNVGEKNNDDDLAKAYAALCDIFVMDAFGTAHRAQASTHGVAKPRTVSYWRKVLMKPALFHLGRQQQPHTMCMTRRPYLFIFTIRCSDFNESATSSGPLPINAPEDFYWAPLQGAQHSQVRVCNIKMAAAI